MKNHILRILASLLILTGCSSKSEQAVSEICNDQDTSLKTQWESILSKTYPNLEISTIGSICSLQNGENLVGFAYLNPADDFLGSGQKISLFDSNHALIKETPDQMIRLMNELMAPQITTTENGKFILEFHYKSEACEENTYFNFDLNTFETSLDEAKSNGACNPFAS